jgi:hypothetical protein
MHTPGFPSTMSLTVENENQVHVLGGTLTRTPTSNDSGAGPYELAIGDLGPGESFETVVEPPDYLLIQPNVAAGTRPLAQGPVHAHLCPGRTAADTIVGT